MYRELEDFWHFSRRYRLYQTISGLSHDLLDREHPLSEPAREALERLNGKRIACQQKIAALNLPSFARCGDCQGACCREPSEHYFTALDYWLRRGTPHYVETFAGQKPLALHRFVGLRLIAGWQRLTAPSPPPVAQVQRRGTACSHLGEHGCRLSYPERPLKCLIFACQGLKSSLDASTRETYIQAIKELQQISRETFDVLKQEAGRPPYYGAASILFTL
jgi:Fe-S-cluster containining protein